MLAEAELIPSVRLQGIFFHELNRYLAGQVSMEAAGYIDLG